VVIHDDARSLGVVFESEWAAPAGAFLALCGQVAACPQAGGDAGGLAAAQPEWKEGQHLHQRPISSAGENQGVTPLESRQGFPRTLSCVDPEKSRGPADHAPCGPGDFVELGVTGPGHTCVTMTPVPARSARKLSVKPATKCLLPT
jgi:hypothetical protein